MQLDEKVRDSANDYNRQKQLSKQVMLQRVEVDKLRANDFLRKSRSQFHLARNLDTETMRAKTKSVIGRAKV